jgi:hypothetical protein
VMPTNSILPIVLAIWYEGEIKVDVDAVVQRREHYWSR